MINITLNDNQLIAIILAITKPEEKGRLLQVQTGEGKSFIIICIAIVKALQGYKVDIVTSSSVLAQRDSIENASIYRLFALTCDNNNDKFVYIKGPKNCYKSDIVYGDSASFQFDILRQEYSDLQTMVMGNNNNSEIRGQEFIIVDEVDSMLLDDCSKISRLSSTIPATDLLQPLYIIIWKQLEYYTERIIRINEKVYMVFGKVKFRMNGKIELEYYEKNGDLKRIEDLKFFIQQNLKYYNNIDFLEDLGIEIKEDIKQFLLRKLEELIKSYTNQQQYEKINIPEHLDEFVSIQIGKWVESAVTALSYQEDIHYVVDQKQIKPVDYFGTGIVQAMTNWGNGLHQFLQIKHHLEMTPENITTNFLSNVGFIKRYKSNLIGLSGTMGNAHTQHELCENYQVDIIQIPSKKKKQFLQLPKQSFSERKVYQDYIVSQGIAEAMKERAVLIICESISEANLFEDLFKSYISQHKLSQIQITSYTMNNMGQEKYIKEARNRQIIIATNLAGRGTDIGALRIEEYGGLHVIISFKQQNERVENQALGRTSRQGKCGSGQIIIHESKTKQQTVIQNKLNNKKYNICNNNNAVVIANKDVIFEQFCRLFSRLRRQIKEYELRKQREGSVLSAIKQDIFGVRNKEASMFEKIILKAVEEKWGMFLLKKEQESLFLKDLSQILSAYRRFQDQYENVNDNFTSLIENSFHFTNLGIYFLESKKDKEKGKQYLKEAISREKYYSAGAYSFLGQTCLENKEDLQEIEQQYLKCLKKTSNELILYNVCKQFLCDPKLQSTSLLKQLNIRIDLLSTFIDNIQNECLIPIRKAQRPIDLIIHKSSQEQKHIYDLKSVQQVEFKLPNQKECTIIYKGQNSSMIRKSIDKIWNAISKKDNPWYKKLKFWSDEYEDKKNQNIHQNQMNLAFQTQLSSFQSSILEDFINNNRGGGQSGVQVSVNLDDFYDIDKFVQGFSEYFSGLDRRMGLEIYGLYSDVQYWVEGMVNCNQIDVDRIVLYERYDSSYEETNNERNSYNLSNLNQILQEIENFNESDTIRIQFSNLSSKTLQKMMDVYQKGQNEEQGFKENHQTVFNLQTQDLNPEESYKFLEYMANKSYDFLSKTAEITLKNVSREAGLELFENKTMKSLDINLIFADIKPGFVKVILEHVDRTKNELKIANSKQIQDKYNKIIKVKKDLLYLKERGIYQLLYIQEKESNFWKILLLVGLGLIAILSLSCLAFTALGAVCSLGKFVMLPNIMLKMQAIIHSFSPRGLSYMLSNNLFKGLLGSFQKSIRNRVVQVAVNVACIVYAGNQLMNLSKVDQRRYSLQSMFAKYIQQGVSNQIKVRFSMPYNRQFLKQCFVLQSMYGKRDRRYTKKIQKGILERFEEEFGKNDGWVQGFDVAGKILGVLNIPWGGVVMGVLGLIEKFWGVRQYNASIQQIQEFYYEELGGLKGIFKQDFQNHMGNQTDFYDQKGNNCFIKEIILKNCENMNENWDMNQSEFDALVDKIYDCLFVERENQSRFMNEELNVVSKFEERIEDCKYIQGKGMKKQCKQFIFQVIKASGKLELELEFSRFMKPIEEEIARLFIDRLGIEYKEGQENQNGSILLTYQDKMMKNIGENMKIKKLDFENHDNDNAQNFTLLQQNIERRQSELQQRHNNLPGINWIGDIVGWEQQDNNNINNNNKMNLEQFDEQIFRVNQKVQKKKQYLMGFCDCFSFSQKKFKKITPNTTLLEWNRNIKIIVQKQPHNNNNHI